jgi:PAS domain-containing protein
MSSGDPQAVLAPTWTDPRIHLLDDTWLLTIFAILLATVVPWLVSALDINFVAACLGLLALGAIHISFTIVGKPVRVGERRPVLTLLHMAGIIIVGFVWSNAGGLQNPAFLMVFTLPVVAAIFLSRWQPYLMALLAILVTGVVALAQAPELRWYVPGLDTAGATLAAVLGQQRATSTFPGFYAPSAFYAVLLQVFAILLFACAVAAEYLGTIFERLHSHVTAARVEAERGQEFWTALVESMPAPALLVDSDTMQVVCASVQATRYQTDESITGRSLFETIRFSYPEMVQELIMGTGGVVPLSMIHMHDRLRATEVQVRHLAQTGSRFALVVIRDKTEEFTAHAALDVSGQAMLVIDSQGRLLSFNKPAQALFAALEKDADASALLSLGGMPPRWWEPGLTGRRKMHVEIGPRVYQVTCSATPLPGEDDRLYIVGLLPMGRAALGERSDVTATAQLPDAAKNDLSKSTLVTPP